MSRILITGSGAGLGMALYVALAKQHVRVIGYDRKNGDDVQAPSQWVRELDIDVLINNAGVNITGWLEDFKPDQWDEVMGVNAKGIYLMTQACLPALARNKGTVVNIVSNAAHMPMTTSLAYNASKGAAHIMTLQLARELGRKHGITVFGVAPNKMAGTEMSKDIEDQVLKHRGWTPEFARKYQMDALLAGAETPPEMVASFIAYLLQDKEHHRYLTGTVIPYGA